MNLQALGSLLRAFRRGEGSSLGAAPTAPLAGVTAALRAADAALRAIATGPVTAPLGDDFRRHAGARPLAASVRGSDQTSARRAGDVIDIEAMKRAPLDVVVVRDRSIEATALRHDADAEELPPGESSLSRRGSALPGTIAPHRPLEAVGTASPGRHLLDAANAPTISPTAHWVSDLMQEPLPAKLATIRQVAPLLAAPPAAAAPLAVALRDCVERSGLFYESHLAQWALHRFAHNTLEQEPQAYWHADDMPQGQSVVVMPDGETPGAGPVEAANPSMHVRMQLATLESGQIRWQGEAWPRQSAAIEIEEDGGGNARHSQDASPRWRSRLRMSLPRIGGVDAQIVLTGKVLQLTLRPHSEASAHLLRAAQAELASALAAHFELRSIDIDHAPAQ